jgi:NADPH:quinone reductase-like Zn-dependent oxidoreductase
MVLPTINKALRYSSLGGDLEIFEKDIPLLPANEILVKVHAASINPCDIQLWRSGLVAVVAGDKGMGKDFSGTVVAAGSGVKGWAEGDEIFGLLFHVVCSPSLLFNIIITESFSLVKAPSVNISMSIHLRIRLPRNPVASPTSRQHPFPW